MLSIMLPIMHVNVYCICNALCICCLKPVSEGLWELSDNVSEYEKLLILHAVAMGLGALGIHV